MITGTEILFLIGAFLLGMLIAFVLVTPSRAAMDRNVRARNREEKVMEREVNDLRRQHAQLEAEHTGVVAERDHLRQQLASTSAPATPAAADGRDTLERRRDMERTERTETATREEQPGVGERLREMFQTPTSRDESHDGAERTTDSPPTPTA